MDNIVGRLQSAFPSHQLDVIIGSLLGDVRLECRSKGIRASYTARLRVHHGDKQKEYVWWKYKMLKDLVSKEPREISWLNKKRNLKEVSWYFHTKSLKNFGIIHEIFYKNGVKKFPTEILPIFSDQMLAVWYMDDGSKSYKSCYFNTQQLDISSQLNLILMFKKLGIKSSLNKDKTYFRIRIATASVPILFGMIKKHIVSSMRYKLPI